MKRRCFGLLSLLLFLCIPYGLDVENNAGIRDLGHDCVVA